MKKYVKASSESWDNLEIVSIAVVDDAREYNPRNDYVYDVMATKDINYGSLTREQLLQLPKKVRQNIHDVRILRKLNYDELTIQQQREVTLANEEKFQSNRKSVESVLAKLQDADIFILPRKKNKCFKQLLRDKGAKLTESAVRDIISKLSYSDYSHSTLSILDIDWNALLMVFEYNGECVFDPIHQGDAPVTMNGLTIYIKIDVETKTDEGYVALSFHTSDYNN